MTCTVYVYFSLRNVLYSVSQRFPNIGDRGIIRKPHDYYVIACLTSRFNLSVVISLNRNHGILVRLVMQSGRDRDHVDTNLLSFIGRLGWVGNRVGLGT